MRGRTNCPICKGTGTVTEDGKVYDFETRDPQTSKCLICNGEGTLPSSKRLPNGQPQSSLRYAKTSQRLNVSKKAAINPEVVDTGLGYRPSVDDMDDMDGMDGMDKPGVERSKEPYEKPLFYEMASNPRLNKVLASGKMFLIVTETEPYYLAVYRMIREQEKRQGTWTEQDEDNYVETLEEQIKRYQEVING